MTSSTVACFPSPLELGALAFASARCGRSLPQKTLGRGEFFSSFAVMNGPTSSYFALVVLASEGVFGGIGDWTLDGGGDHVLNLLR